MKITIHSESELADVAKKMLEAFPNDRVFCFYGQMGAGKTTFIKAVCQQLGVADTTSSPTFAIVNEYVTDSDETIYHFDFYRIEKLEDAYQIGADDYFYSGNYCFVEWAENIPELIDSEFVKVKINISSDDSREFEFGYDALK